MLNTPYRKSAQTACLPGGLFLFCPHPGPLPRGEGAVAAPQPRAERPNIVIVLIDDVGFSDIGCYGSEIPTPNLDALAAGGLRFTQFYNCARCSPTRASLLTGLYPHQAGMGWLDNKVEPTSQVGRVRMKSGLSQSQFAAALGVSKRTLEQWEQGRREPSGAAQTLLKIADRHPEFLLEVAG